MDLKYVSRLRVKSNPKLEHIPIIFLSALEKEADILKGFEIGAVDYITKPFEPKVLEARVRTHVNLKLYQDIIIKSLKEKDEILLTQSKMATLGEMFENIAHQWKQPISVISMSCANIRVEHALSILNDEKLIEYLDEVDNSIANLTQTVDDFRDFVNDKGEKEEFDLSIFITKTSKLLSSKLKNRDIKVKNLTNSCMLNSYKNDLTQVVLNIFNNAIDALSKKDGDKWIGVSCNCIDKSSCVIKICDSGDGIKLEVIDKIFDKYVTTKKGEGGSGLGLYMSKKIMQKRIGGDIIAYNGDIGACFELNIPS